MAADDLHKPDSTVFVGSDEDEKTKSKMEFSEDEETLIMRMYNLVGEKWALIAGRIPGRSADEIETYWNSKHSTNKSAFQKEACRKIERI